MKKLPSVPDVFILLLFVDYSYSHSRTPSPKLPFSSGYLLLFYSKHICVDISYYTTHNNDKLRV